MTVASSNRRKARWAVVLLTVIVGVPTACTLDLAGQPPGGTGGSTSASTASTTSTSAGTSGSTSATTSGSSGTGGAAPLCVPGEMSSCYGGPMGTENQGVCKSGMHACQPDGMSYGACANQVLPSAENCLKPADEDCDGKALACTGDTQKSGSLGVAANDDVIFAVATDLSGNVFVGGVSGATPPAGASFTMQNGSGAVVQFKKDGTKGWSAQLSTSVVGGYSVVRGLATDKQGNVFVVGEFQGTTSGGTISVVGAGGIDIFLAKLDPSGKTLWAKPFGIAADQSGYGVAVDPAGNVIITGRAVGAVDFGGGVPVPTPSGGNNVFVARFDTNGNHLWSKTFGDDGDQTAYSVATTPAGDVVLAGELTGIIDFGGITVASAGGVDVFVAKLAGGSGAPMWAHAYGDDTHDQSASGVAVGSDSSVVITGSMVGKCNFGGANLDAKNSLNVFVAKLHPDGSHDWSHDYGSDMDRQVATGVAVDPAQNILVVGYFGGDLSFADMATTLHGTDLTSFTTDIFVAKLAADGKGVWARSFGDLSDQTAWAVTADPVSNVVFGGTYQGTVNLMPPTLTSSGNYDALWAQLAP
ncbi:MAG: hypothetical protein ABJE95_00125 [Byssovorax sp.]